MKLNIIIIICVLLLRGTNLTQGRHISKVSARNGDSAGTAQAQDSLKRLLQYYRSQKTENVGTSVEGSPELFEIDLSESQRGKFRLDFSNSYVARDDMVPFAEDVPFGSLAPSPPKPSVASETPEESQDAAIPVDSAYVVISQPEYEQPANLETENAEIENVAVQVNENEMNASEAILASSSVTPDPEEAEKEVTTMFPVDMIGDMTPVVAMVQKLKTSVEEDVSHYDDDDDAEDSEEHCTEGETKRLRCNNACVCVDGAFFCSNRKCEDAGQKSNATQGSSTMKNDAVKTEKKPWGFKKKSPSDTTMPACSSGMTKSVDCNQCVCVMGKWACTKRACIALTLREKASYTDGVSLYNQVGTLVENKDFDEDCIEGVTRQMGCNQCICHLNSWSCSNFTCEPTPPPKKPQEIQEACQKEGDVKSRGCNLCKCNRGIWVCSNNNCNAYEDKDETIPMRYRTSTKTANSNTPKQ